MYSIGELRPGMAVIVEGVPYVITDAQHSKQARAGGLTKTKMKNLLSGAMINQTFQGNDKLEPADLTVSKSQFLYKDDESFYFMDNTSFDQFPLDKDTIGEQANFLVDGMDVDLQYFDGKPISIMLPPKAVFEVIETDPGVKGDTVSSPSKPAKISTGYVLNVPLFVNAGDKIRINTESGMYVERA